MKYFPLVLLFLAGCIGPLNPGHASYTSPDGTVVSAKQSQNPKTETKQDYVRTHETKDGKTTEEVHTVIGAAQKDTAREIGAKLASMRWMQVLGVLVFLFGAASFVYPPLKLVIGSVTTSAVACISGLALMFLPVIVVGNEALLLALSIGAVAIAGVWFFVHRHATVHAKLKTLLPK